jgi:hypothetical protein
MNRLKLFKIGFWIVRRMRFSVKLTVVATVLLAPLLLVLYQLVSKISIDNQSTKVELKGIEIVAKFQYLLFAEQVHLLQTNGERESKATNIVKQKAPENSLDKLLLSVEDALNESHDEIPAKEWNGLRDKLQSTHQQIDASNGTYIEHEQVFGEIRRFIYGLGKESGLLFEPDPATYLVMDMVVSRTLQWSEEIRKLLLGFRSKEELSQQDENTRLESIDSLSTLNKDLEFAIKQTIEFGVVDPSAGTAIQASKALTEAIKEPNTIGDSNSKLRIRELSLSTVDSK